MGREGYVYILTNQSMPGLIKVGMTQAHPSRRAMELSGVTGVPTPFKVAWQAEVEDCAEVEAAVHRALRRYRVNGRREFFATDVQRARAAIERAAVGRIGREFFPRTNFGRKYPPARLLQIGMRAALVALFFAAIQGWI